MKLEQLSHDEVKERYTYQVSCAGEPNCETRPVFNMQSDEIAVYENDAGVLFPEKCVGWLQYRAEHPLPTPEEGEKKPQIGAKLLFNTIVENYSVHSNSETHSDSRAEREDFVIVTTKSAEKIKSSTHIKFSSTTVAESRFKAKKLVLACGSYLPELIERVHCREKQPQSFVENNPQVEFLRNLAVVRRTAHWFQQCPKWNFAVKDKCEEIGEIKAKTAANAWLMSRCICLKRRMGLPFMDFQAA